MLVSRKEQLRISVCSVQTRHINDYTNSYPKRNGNLHTYPLRRQINVLQNIYKPEVTFCWLSLQATRTALQ